MPDMKRYKVIRLRKEIETLKRQMDNGLIPSDPKRLRYLNIYTSAFEQATDEHKENYLRSCEAHGGELAEIVAQVRKELTDIKT